MSETCFLNCCKKPSLDAEITRLRADRDKWMEYATGDRAELALKLERAEAELAQEREENKSNLELVVQVETLRAELAAMDQKWALRYNEKRIECVALTERNAELESELQNLVCTFSGEYDEISTLRERNAKLVEALKQYANKNRWNFSYDIENYWWNGKGPPWETAADALQEVTAVHPTEAPPAPQSPTPPR